MTHIFAYGSLMIPDVMRAVAGRDFHSIKAFLRNHARYRVRGESYPGMIPAKGARTEGILYLDLDSAALNRLDNFEGEWYERVPVRVHTRDGSCLEAETYVFKQEHRGLLTTEAWDCATFQSKHLGAFLQNYRGFQDRR